MVHSVKELFSEFIQINRKGRWGFHLIFINLLSYFTIYSDDIGELLAHGYMSLEFLFFQLCNLSYVIFISFSYQNLKYFIIFPSRRIRRYCYHTIIWWLYFFNVPYRITYVPSILILVYCLICAISDIFFYYLWTLLDYIADLFSNVGPETPILYTNLKKYISPKLGVVKFYLRVFKRIYMNILWPLLDCVIEFGLLLPWGILEDYFVAPFYNSKFYLKYRVYRRYLRIKRRHTTLYIMFSAWYKEWLDDWYGLASQYPLFGGLGYLTYMAMGVILAVKIDVWRLEYQKAAWLAEYYKSLE